MGIVLAGSRGSAAGSSGEDSTTSVPVKPALEPVHRRRFQIGPPCHNYIYTETEMTQNGCPVYRCCRNFDPKEHDLVLLLLKLKDGSWLALSAPDITDPYGWPVFMCMDKDVDPTQEGTYLWESYVDTKWDKKSFETTVLPSLIGPPMD